MNLNCGLEIHILGFCVLHVKWNSLNDLVHGTVIADFSGLDRRLVVSFDYMYFNIIHNALIMMLFFKRPAVKLL